MQEKNSSIAEIILSKIKSYYNLKTYGQLAKFLGVSDGALYSWKARGTIGDYAPILSKCEGISLDWLKTGEGEMFKKTVTAEFTIPLEHRAVGSDKDEDEREMAVKRLLKREEEMDLTDTEFYEFMASISRVLDNLEKQRKGGKLSPSD